MKILNMVEDKIKRHQERHSSLGYDYVIADSIAFLNNSHWDSVAADQTIFLSRDYLQTIETFSPHNTKQRYVMAYSNGVPMVILACQVAEISGEQLLPSNKPRKHSMSKRYKERILVCGNLVSSGLHGIAFAKDIDDATGWKIVAEALYKLRRSEKLSGQIDFAMIKDIKGEQIKVSEVVERFSYRKIQTDPDMVLTLDPSIKTFDDYLQLLSSKYRSRIKKVIKGIDDAGLTCEKLILNKEIDQQLHALYLEVEQKADTRLAALPIGYFHAMSQRLGQHFSCYGILDKATIIGFISIVKDGNSALAYYVGFDYQMNDQHPIYFRLLQLVIQAAIEMQCSQVHFGRSALEPKASLGAKPVDTYVWARHRVPAVNYVVRKLFRNVPFNKAPERNVIKSN